MRSSVYVYVLGIDMSDHIPVKAKARIDWEELINAAGDILAFQVIPHTFSQTARHLCQQEQYGWYYTEIKRPFWDIFGRNMNSMFTIMHTCVGLASYIVYISKNTWYNQATPLVLCGIQLFFDFAWRPLYFNQKDWNRAFRHSLACTILSTMVTAMYTRIDQWAGKLMVPYSIWWFYLTTVVWYVRLVNEPVEPWKRLSFGGGLIMRRPRVPSSLSTM